LLVEPALARRRASLDALVRELGLDDPACPLRFQRRGGVDEQLVPVAGDGQAPAFKLGREPPRLVGAEVEAEPPEQVLGVLLLGELDSDAPVVSHAVAAVRPTSASGHPNMLSDLPV